MNSAYARSHSDRESNATKRLCFYGEEVGGGLAYLRLAASCRSRHRRRSNGRHEPRAWRNNAIAVLVQLSAGLLNAPDMYMDRCGWASHEGSSISTRPSKII